MVSLTAGWAAPWWVQLLYLLAASGLAVYGLYYLVVVVLWASGRNEAPALPEAKEADARPPMVTVQVPVYNERYVVPRVLEAVARLDWPRDRFEVQVLDDSDDGSAPLVASEVARWRAEGVAMVHLRRQDRSGYKAGAMNHGLRAARGDLVAIWDADFVPPSGFLHQVVHHFDRPGVCCVQTRWGHLDEDASWVSRAVAVGLDAHFAVEQAVRGRHDLLLSFNATNCVWRRADLERAGGWPTATLTEDLDLTVRMALAGSRMVYLDRPAVPAEVPLETLGFARQQERWSRGSIENLRAHGGAILRSDWPLLRKLDALFHLAHYVIHPLMFLLFLGLVATVFYAPPPVGLFGLFAVVAASGPALLLVGGQWRFHRRRWVPRLVRIIPLTLLGIGISFRNTCAVVAGTTGRSGRFLRTPKYGEAGRTGGWRLTRYVPRPDRVTWIELFLGIGAFAAAGWALVHGAFALVPGLSLYGVSYLVVSVSSMSELRARRS